MNFWNKLCATKLFIQLVINPNRTDLIFKGIDLVSRNPEQEPLKVIARVVLSHDNFRAMFEQRYIPEIPSLTALSTLPKGTFGHALYLHMTTNNLDFGTFPRVESDQVIIYASTRIYQDHDLWHTILGYGVSVEDELGLQSFGVAQYHSPLGALLVAGGLLHLLVKNPARALDAFRKVADGYYLGKKARFLLGLRLHELFSKPLGEVREICGVL